jgi:hypothetical protein
MHFGQLVSEVIYARNINMDNAAGYMEMTIPELQLLLQKEDWTASEIKNASARLDYDFGKHLSPWDEDFTSFYGTNEVSFYVQYSKETEGDKMEQLNIAIRAKCKELGLNCV